MYKCGDFERCLQLSTQNVDTLLCGDGGPVYVWHARPELLQLMDDNIVSLNALTLIVNPECDLFNDRISQLTLSLYLMTQCQLKLRHSVTSLAQTLDYIEVAQRRHSVQYRPTLDHLTLKLTERKLMIYLSDNMER